MPADTDLLEPDQLAGTPHPREQTAFFGHGEGEAAFLDALAAGRLHHAWLIGGPEGIGKATLAYRVARFLLAHGGAAPTGAHDARGRPATPGGAAGRGPFPSRSRGRPARPAQGRQGLFPGDRGRPRPPRPRPFRLDGGAGRLSHLHRRRRRRPQPVERQRAPQGHRGTAAALDLPHRQPRAAAPPADDPLALPQAAGCAPWATPISPPSSARSDRRSPTRRTPI